LKVIYKMNKKKEKEITFSSTVKVGRESQYK
jgi:hypothetical protein